MWVSLLFFVCFVYGSSDCSYRWGEWAFEECTHRVNEARFQRKDLVRGICEVVQDQLERFIEYEGNKISGETGISFSNTFCPRALSAPYDAQVKKGTREVIQVAIEKNSRDREVLGDELERWGYKWVKRVAGDLDGPGGRIERLRPEELQERYAEYVNREDDGSNQQDEL